VSADLRDGIPPPRRAGPRLRLTRTERLAAGVGLVATSIPVLLLLWETLVRR
jgi:hypothetical protein